MPARKKTKTVIDMQGMTPRAYYRTLITTIAVQNGSSYEEITGRVRTDNLVNIRRIIAKRLREKHNLSFPKIGLYMNRDNSSIQNLLRPKKNRYVPGSRRKKKLVSKTLPFVAILTLDELLATA